MKLRTKTLLGVGILLLLMVITMSLLPAYFVKKDITKARDQIQRLLTENHLKLLKSQKIWTELTYDETNENIRAILDMLGDAGGFSSNLALIDEKSRRNALMAMAHLASLDPSIGIIQSQSVSGNLSEVLTPANAKLYSTSLKEEEDIFRFELEGKETLKGFLLPHEMQVDGGNLFYLLIPGNTKSEEVKKIKKKLAMIKVEQDSRHTTDFTSPFKEIKKSWTLKMQMIRLLTQIYSATQETTVSGLALMELNEGKSILSEDIYRKSPLFDAANFHKEVMHEGKNPVALIMDPEGDHFYFTQVEKIENTIIALGASFKELIQELALSSNQKIIAIADGLFWMGYDGQGKPLSDREIQKFKQFGLSDDLGSIEINKEKFQYYFLSSLADGRVRIYQIRGEGGVTTFFDTMIDLENMLSGKISLQLSLISLGTMLLVLLFIGRLGLQIISPITKLAKATDDVVHGRYEDIQLPEMGRRRDEVALLTHSFGDMVKGLEEREKIRGVLDKVVSKDVADEILRSQIHLGGEDRIVTMLFSDIRDFTNLTQNFSPQKTINLLNMCMTKISKVIEGEGGIIDKYVGDEVMAIFGAPTTYPDHALRAISAGILIIETLKKWNLSRVEAGLHPLEMGMGIHTGLVVAGNMGAEDRLNYTVLGSNVNLAARLCEIASRNQLIISENTFREPNIKESFRVNKLPPITLKGFSEPVEIYEVAGFKWEET